MLNAVDGDFQILLFVDPEYSGFEGSANQTLHTVVVGH